MPGATKKTPQIYLFYGEEGLLVRQLANKIIESLLAPDEREFNLVSMETDPGVPELLHLVESAPFFGDHKVVVIRNTKLFQASRRKAANADGQEDTEVEDGETATDAGKESSDTTDPRLLHLLGHMPPYSTLVFTAVKADKRRKLTKAVAEHGGQGAEPVSAHGRKGNPELGGRTSGRMGQASQPGRNGSSHGRCFHDESDFQGVSLRRSGKSRIVCG